MANTLLSLEQIYHRYSISRDIFNDITLNNIAIDNPDKTLTAIGNDLIKIDVITQIKMMNI